jgi:hypothetical protein
VGPCARPLDIKEPLKGGIGIVYKSKAAFSIMAVEKFAKTIGCLRRQYIYILL